MHIIELSTFRKKEIFMRDARTKILGVNTRPDVTTYIHHAFINSIAGNTMVFNGWINNASNYMWEQCTYDTVIRIVNNYISVDEVNEGINREGIIYRKCQKKDELILEVHNIDMSAEHPIINLFISGLDPKKCITDNIDIYRLGIHRYGVMVSDNGVVEKDISLDINIITKFKINIKKNIIHTYYYTISDGWQEIIELKSRIKNDEMFIGINYNNLGSIINRREYNAWLYMNYLQIMIYEEDKLDIAIDYDVLPVKNYRFESLLSNQFMDIQYLKINEVQLSFKNLHDYLKHSINNNYYISLCFDEYYIPNRDAYKKYHYFHYNLVYGYDDVNEEYYICGFSDKIVFEKIAYKVIESVGLGNDSEIIRYKSCKNTTKYEFDKSLFVQDLKDYLNGTCLSYIKKFCTRIGKVYGIKVYEYLINTEKGKELLVNDIRISYLLYEHAQIMRKRFVYFEEEHVFYFSDDIKNELGNLCEKMLVVAKTVNLLVLKRKMMNSDNTKEIFTELRNLYEIQKKFYIKLFNSIKGEEEIKVCTKEIM